MGDSLELRLLNSKLTGGIQEYVLQGIYRDVFPYSLLTTSK